MNVRARWAMLLAGVVLSWAVVLWLVLRDPPPFIDLLVYRAGGYAWLHGIPLYGPEFRSLLTVLPLPFLYPPISAVLFSPLTVVPFPVAVVLLTGAGLGCLALVCWLTARRLEPDRWWGAQLAAAAVVLGTMTEPVRETLLFGQVNLVLMGLVVADCLLPRTPWPRGMLIGLAAAIKLTPAVFVLFFLAHRQWRPVLAAGTAFLVATVAGLLAAPAASVTYWYGGVFAVPSWIGAPAFPSNQSLTGLLHRVAPWLPDPWHTAIWLPAALTVVAVAGLAVRRLRSHGHDVTAMLTLAAAGLLASPLSWSHHYVWVVPALILAAHQALRAPRWWPVVAALVGVFLVGPHWQVATRTERVPDWDLGEQIVGHSYLWLALLFLVVTAIRARPVHPVPRDGSPAQVREFSR